MRRFSDEGQISSLVEDQDGEYVLWEDAKARIDALEEFVSYTADNYPCDENAHRHGTTCRVCQARALLGGE